MRNAHRNKEVLPLARGRERDEEGRLASPRRKEERQPCAIARLEGGRRAREAAEERREGASERERRKSDEEPLFSPQGRRRRGGAPCRRHFSCVVPLAATNYPTTTRHGSTTKLILLVSLSRLSRDTICQNIAGAIPSRPFLLLGSRPKLAGDGPLERMDRIDWFRRAWTRLIFEILSRAPPLMSLGIVEVWRKDPCEEHTYWSNDGFGKIENRERVNPLLRDAFWILWNLSSYRYCFI